MFYRNLGGSGRPTGDRGGPPLLRGLPAGSVPVYAQGRLVSGGGARYLLVGPPVPPKSAPQLNKRACLMFVLRHLLMICMYVLC